MARLRPFCWCTSIVRYMVNIPYNLYPTGVEHNQWGPCHELEAMGGRMHEIEIRGVLKKNFPRNLCDPQTPSLLRILSLQLVHLEGLRISLVPNHCCWVVRMCECYWYVTVCHAVSRSLNHQFSTHQLYLLTHILPHHFKIQKKCSIF